MQGRDNISGAMLFYSLGIIVVGFFLCFAVIDFFQITNIKETLDNDIKRAISYNLITYINDKHSSDRQAFLKDEDKLLLQTSLKYDIEKELKNKYKADIYINTFKLILKENKIYIKYTATIYYTPIVLRNKMRYKMPIKVTGRSKVQRFDTV